MPCLSPSAPLPQQPPVAPKPMGGKSRLEYCQVLPNGPPFQLKSPQEAYIDSLPAVPLPPKQINLSDSKAEPATTDNVEQDDKALSNEKEESEKNELQNGQKAIALSAASEPQILQSTSESAVVPVIDNADVEGVIKPTVSKETKQESEPGENSVPQEENEKQLEKPAPVLQESGAANEEETFADSKKADADGAPSETPAVENAIVPAEAISRGDLKSASAESSAEAASAVSSEHADVTDGVKREEEENTICAKGIADQNCEEKKATSEGSAEEQPAAAKEQDNKNDKEQPQ